MQEFGWRGSLIIFAALHLHTICVACLVNEKNNSSNSTNEKGMVIEKEKSATYNEIIAGLTTIKNTLFLISCLIFCFGLSIVSTHIAAYAQDLGFDRSFGDLLISVLGLCGIFGRICIGLIGQSGLISVPTVHGIAYMLAGVSISICAIWPTYYVILVAIGSYGFFYSSVGPTLSETAYVLVSPHVFSYAYGFSQFACGIGGVVGGPVAGKLN